MSKKEEVKENLAELRFWRGIVVGLLIALLGWLLTSLYSDLYEQISKIFLVGAGVLLAILCVLLFFISKAIKRKIMEIRKL